MKSFKKILFLTFFTCVLLARTAFAVEDSSWLDKVNRFFGRKTEVTTETPAPKPTSPEKPAEAWKPEFDFSEKTIGDRHAPIKITIFSSLTCPHCTKAHIQLLPYLKKKYVNKGEVLLILTDFPIDSRATTASMISRCLTGDMYYAFMETLYKNQRKWAFTNNLQESLLPYAKLAGLSEEQMTACATDEKGLKELLRQRNLTSMQFKIHATPTILIQSENGKEFIQGVPTPSEIDEAIEQLKSEETFSDMSY